MPPGGTACLSPVCVSGRLNPSSVRFIVNPSKLNFLRGASGCVCYSGGVQACSRQHGCGCTAVLALDDRSSTRIAEDQGHSFSGWRSVRSSDHMAQELLPRLVQPACVRMSAIFASISIGKVQLQCPRRRGDGSDAHDEQVT